MCCLAFGAREDDNPSCLWTTVQLLSTDSILTLSSPRKLFSQFDTSSPLLFQLVTFWAHQSIWSSLVVRYFEHSLVYKWPIQCDAVQNPAIWTCPNPSGPCPYVFHLLQVKHGLILCRNLKRHHYVSVH